MSCGIARVPYEVTYKILQHEAFSRAHEGHVIAQGIFFGLGQMQGLGLQHLHGMGFIMARLEAPDGLPVFSGPSYIEICSARAGVGAGTYTGAGLSTCLSGILSCREWGGITTADIKAADGLLILSAPSCTKNCSAGAGVGATSHLGIPCAKASARLNVLHAELLGRTADLDSVIATCTGPRGLSH